MEITERFTGFTSRPKRFFSQPVDRKGADGLIVHSGCVSVDRILWPCLGPILWQPISQPPTKKKILRVYQHSIHAKYIYQGQLNRYTMPALIYHCLLGISVDRSLFRCTAAALIWLGDRRKDPRDKPSTISRGLQPLFSLDIFHHNHLLLSIPSCH